MSSIRSTNKAGEPLDQIIEEKDKILSLIYDTVGDVIFALEVQSEGEYVFSSVNKSFLSATGLQRDQVVGKNVRDVIPEPSLTMVLGHYETAITTQSSVNWEEITPYPTGTKIGKVTIAPVFGNSGACTMLIGSVHDITDSRNYAKKLEESMEKIAQKNDELEQLGYVTSHDLQEPLNTIQSFSMLLKEAIAHEPNEEQTLKYLEFIDSATSRMQLLLRSMIEYNRIGKQSELKEVDLKALVNEVLSDLAGSIMKVGAHVSVGELPTMKVYDTELRLLFQNLIGNAIKYRRPDVAIEVDITCEKIDEGWQFEVKDNGIGIDEAYFERIFQIFQRLHKRHEYEGSGIGLSICKKVTDLHQGRIWVEHNSTQGSTFCFTLSSELA